MFNMYLNTNNKGAPMHIETALQRMSYIEKFELRPACQEANCRAKARWMVTEIIVDEQGQAHSRYDTKLCDMHADELANVLHLDKLKQENLPF
jgi:hypothetical protein